MNDSPNIDTLHMQVILLKMRAKTTEELLTILSDKTKTWSKEEREIAQRVIQERTRKLHEQTTQAESKPRIDMKESTGNSFFNLSPIGNLQAAVAIFVLIGFFIGFIFVSMGRQNTQWFLRFARNSQVSDIEKIELQEFDQNRNNIGNPITITDQENIKSFVSVFRTIEEYSTYHPTQDKRIRVKIWLTEKNQIIEFEGYTLSGEGLTFYVSNLRLESRMWKFGDGNEKFPAPAFYEWLENVGIDL